jgi:alpha-L-rhamnosidase
MSMNIHHLLVQYLKNPIGIGTKYPVLSYTLESAEQSQLQSASRILVASSAERLQQNIGDLWDSGKRPGSHCWTEYAGAALSSRQEVFWKVKVWDKHDIESDWSEAASWEMGLLDGKEWTASWIGEGDAADCDKAAAPALAVDFTVENLPGIVKARVYISGLGLFQASINGRPLDEAYFNPGESDYSQTVYYVTYDIMNLLQEGPNAIGLIIGNGQYVNFKVNPVMVLEDGSEAPQHRYQKNDGGYVRAGLYGDKKALAQIELTYANGCVEIVAATDETWKLTNSPITFNNWYGGEDYDATAEISGWDQPNTDRTGWTNAVRMKEPLGRLTGRECKPVKLVERFPAASVIRLDNGNLLVDMGRNIAGFPELVLDGTQAADRGKVIQMYPAEILNEAGTGVDQASCTQSWSDKYNCSIVNSYTVRGTGKESWHPIFCYQGFRYVEVTGFEWDASVDHFNCCVLRVDNEKTGQFETSNPILNQINQITEHAIESNMFFSFTDCPQIEKLGWLETSHLMFRSISAGYDIRSWIPKIVRDMIDAQTNEIDIQNGDKEELGYMPAIAPEYHRIVGLHRDPNWGGACILTPWEYYQNYGDAALLKQAYPAMKKYMTYLDNHTTNGLLMGYCQMGDWGQLNENTPNLLVENCAYFYLLSTMARIALLTGEQQDADYFSAKARSVQALFHQNEVCYQPASGVYGNGSQASYGCVLFSDIVLEENRASAVEKLKEAVSLRDFHLTSGEVGLKQVFASLGKYGGNDVVYQMVMNDTQPSYKFFVDNGLTTLPEYWNYEELWVGMVRSRNHAMMGHVKEWLTAYVLGIRLAAPGFQQIVIEPALTAVIAKAQGSLLSPYGVISMAYSRDERQFHMEVQIPVGTTANIGVPAVGAGALTVNGQECHVEKVEHIYWIQNIGSGNYQFVVR